MLSKLRNRLRKNLLKNNAGQGATEYILLVAVVVGVVMLFGPKLKEKISGATDRLGTSIDTSVSNSIE